MKHISIRIVSFILSIFIFFTSLCSFYLPAYAYTPDDFMEGAHSWEEMTTSQKWITVYMYVVSQVKAVVTADFSGYLENDESFTQYRESHDPDDFATDTGLVIPADFVALIKQALLEYADETNPFKIEKTYPVNAIPASTFYSEDAYTIFKSYCASHAIVSANPQGSDWYLGDITPYIKEGGGFVKEGSSIVIYNASWKAQSIPINKYLQKNNVDGSVTIETFESWGIQTYHSHYSPDKTNFKEFNQKPFIVTRDGGRIRVFNSATEFMDYDAGQRKVYFGSDFYDKETGAIKVSYDELMDYMDGKYDKLIEDLRDLIGDNPGLSEEELEKLVDKLLGRIGEIGDNQQETNGILSGIAASLSGYFSSVLAKLDEILSAIEALVWIEADDRLEGDRTDLFDLIDAIWKNPQEGSQEAADTLTSSFSEIATGITKKFPFSIPWDIHALFTIFTGTPPPGEARYRTVTLGTAPFTIDPADIRQDGHEAPYFVLPLVVESYGISEDVVIDLKDFKTVSTLSRGLLSALFGVFLIKFTIRIIELFKGGAGD